DGVYPAVDTSTPLSVTAGGAQDDSSTSAAEEQNRYSIVRLLADMESSVLCFYNTQKNGCHYSTRSNYISTGKSNENI
ncbi:MAG TPA: hypothetical protein PLA88_07855, partial [Bacteroidales bacterium]|nr:hypothetical protein [Bacteroidales bacterium]